MTVALLVSAVVLFTPASGVPTALSGFDKAVHLVLFTLLALSARFAGMRIPIVLVLMLGYAALSELLQSLLPIGRDGNVPDGLVDAAGVLLGVALYTGARRLGGPERS
ncbi:MAG: VanZ family protein [Pseudonocardia sp.]|nr:VanZ family protein [Pseudonocardia sp.]